jgi:hypothetical protein
MESNTGDKRLLVTAVCTWPEAPSYLRAAGDINDQHGGTAR